MSSVAPEQNLRDDPVGRMAPELAKFGLQIDNIADAYTVYWVQAWEAAHGVSGESTRAQAQAVRAQAVAGLLASGTLTGASAARKQELADALLVHAVLLGAFQDQNKDNPVLLRQMAVAVRQGARAAGLDLDAMTLTKQGFVAAKH